MFWVWLIVAVVIFGVGIYKLDTVNEPESIKNHIFWLILVVSVFWPIALVIVILALVERKRKKKEESASVAPRFDAGGNELDFF
jgi:ABC-type Co2+ transport system permease subunit